MTRIRASGVRVTVGPSWARYTPTGQLLAPAPPPGDAPRFRKCFGHTRIGMVAGRSHSLAGAARVHGYRAALEEARIAYDPAIVRSTDFDYAEALAAGLQILRADDPPTAVFAASDAQALGVLEAARRHGLAVPGDLAVMSFDDTLVAAMACPPLSAVRQPFEELGREATRVLLDLSQGRPPASPRIELATELVLRTSTTTRRTQAHAGG
ncbi:substrate-binding domain-containing protein [Streptomyces sp. NPDC002888]|uniref:substrate-binding domain-containing protein n=1 Tax=Streptomyces sp. NPDC002888 TaxID=3364668 RepID=UPI0036BC48E1